MDFEAYRNKDTYPVRPDRPLRPNFKNVTPAELRRYADDVEKYEREMVGFKLRRNEWDKTQSQLDARFKNDAIREAGLEGHPKAAQCWEKAWRLGKDNGNYSVIDWLMEFAEVVL